MYTQVIFSKQVSCQTSTPNVPLPALYFWREFFCWITFYFQEFQSAEIGNKNKNYRSWTKINRKSQRNQTFLDATNVWILSVTFYYIIQLSFEFFSLTFQNQSAAGGGGCNPTNKLKSLKLIILTIHVIS